MSGPETRKEQDRLARLVHEAVAGLPPAPDRVWTALEARLRRPAEPETIAQAIIDLSRATIDALLNSLGGEAPQVAALTLSLASMALATVFGE